MSERLHELEAYEIMQQTQEKLHSKYMMSATLEECFNQNFLENFQKEFISQNIEGKQYYTRILLMSKCFHSTKHPFAEYKKYDSENAQSPIIEIPKKLNPTNVEDFASIFIELNANNVLDTKLIYMITYSLIPSFYLMFLEKNIFEKFIKFINELKLDYEQNPNTIPLHYLFSRSLFVSPIFLSFVRKVLHNILQPAYGSDQSNISISRIKHQIIFSFKENIHRIPSYIVHFFSKVKDTYNFLDKCFFEPLIDNPTLFLIVDFNVVSNKKMTEFREVLKSLFDEQLKREISEIVDQNKKSEKSIFIPDKGQAKQISDQTKFKVINSIDQIAIKLILDRYDLVSKKDSNDDDDDDDNNNNNNTDNNSNNNNDNSSNNNNDNKNEDIKKKDFKLVKNNSDINSQILGINYEIYKALFSEETISGNQKFLINTLMSKKSDNWMYLRYILKNAQPIPKKCNLTNEDEINSQSFADIVKEFVVDSFGPNEIVDAYIALERFRTGLGEAIFISPQKFKEKMNNLITNHDEQEKAMQMISRFNKELHYLQDKMKDSLLLIKQAFLVYLIDLYEIDKEQDLPEIPKRAIDIISDPQKYIKMYEKYIEKQEKNAKYLTGNDCRNILCGHFYQNLDFYSYLTFRSDLNKFDELARQCCQRHLTESFNQKYVQKVYKKVHDMTIFNDSYKELNHAFEINGDPITKSKAIFDAIIGIFSSIKSSYGNLGADYYLPIRFYIFSLINPPHLISNIVFLYEFLYYKSSELFENDDFNNYETCIQTIIDELTIFTKFPIIRLARTKRRSCELFITGNDSKMIVDMLNKILSLFKGSNVINESEKNQVIKEIEANEDKILTFEQGAYKFNRNILFNNFAVDSNTVIFNYYIEIKINIGLKIPLTQVAHDKKYDLRLATYIRNKSNTGLFNINTNKDIRNFVDDNGLNNNMKTILLDQKDPKFKKQDVKVDLFDNYIHEFYKIIDTKWREHI